MTKTLIAAEEISRVFKKGSENIHALQSVSFTIPESAFVCISGPSGSGKSTLLYILGLLDTPTSGTYSLHGEAVQTIDDNKRSLLRNQQFGFIFQSFHLLSRSNALQNVMLPLLYASSNNRTLDKATMKSLAEKALLKVGLSERIYHKPNELSGGQRQRVAIARALVNNPSILIADEPTGNLDTKNAAEIMNIFSVLNREGKTIILVTHNPEMEAYATMKILLRDGKIVSCS
jgi:putative ABC transport system ATP-binding protein